jgi:hypothetical protein
MQTTSPSHHQLNATGVARWFLITALIGCLIGLGTAPAQARYGRHHIYVYISSGDQGPLGPSTDRDTESIVRRVHPGNGVTFQVTAQERNDPHPGPFVQGCSSSKAIDVRYILEGRRHDRDITRRVTHDGWRPRGWNRFYWDLSIRVAVHVGDRARLGSQLSCDVAVNHHPVNATVEVV